MKWLCTIVFVPTPAFAWEFTSGLPCVLTHETEQAQIELTYDPIAPLYTVTVTLSEPWPEARLFEMRFDGPQGRRIGTDRHRLSNNGRSLTVEDRGFGNVLDGLQFNFTATAIAGDSNVSFSLENAAKAVAEFRNCEIAPQV